MDKSKTPIPVHNDKMFKIFSNRLLWVSLLVISIFLIKGKIPNENEGMSLDFFRSA